jgi:LCP family protein required for cell wall assembly
MLAILIGSGGFLGYKFYEDASKLTGNKDPVALLSALLPAKLNETNGRVNILLAGYSADDPDHQGADLTDSIMIISIDPSTKSAVMISVPRDLYVNIPGFGYSKINAAYEDGQSENYNASGYVNGGMGLLEKVVSQDFGVTFDYDALVNYEAFKDTVNAVGGVTVDIKSDDSNGLYDPNTNLDLPDGNVTLNGQEALNLARARGDGAGSYGFPDGDFDRTEHQQQLLMALKNKIGTGSLITDPLKITKLADAIGNNIKTDMSLGDMEALYKDTKGISDSNIKQVTLNSYNGTDYLSDYTSEDGEDALVPAAGANNYSAIQTVVSNLLDN